MREGRKPGFGLIVLGCGLALFAAGYAWASGCNLDGLGECTPLGAFRMSPTSVETTAALLVVPGIGLTMLGLVMTAAALLRRKD